MGGIGADRVIPAGAANTVIVYQHRRNHAGSSPRVRGTRPCTERRIARGRFSPAGAGNTATRIFGTGYRSVHPRGCGEHQTTRLNSMPINGSSPRVRGTLQALIVFVCNSRFIPAGAGNTVVSMMFGRSMPVHPRGCGEHG